MFLSLESSDVCTDIATNEPCDGGANEELCDDRACCWSDEAGCYHSNGAGYYFYVKHPWLAYLKYWSGTGIYNRAICILCFLYFTLCVFQRVLLVLKVSSVRPAVFTPRHASMDRTTLKKNVSMLAAAGKRHQMIPCLGATVNLSSSLFCSNRKVCLGYPMDDSSVWYMLTRRIYVFGFLNRHHRWWRQMWRGGQYSVWRRRPWPLWWPWMLLQ